MGKKTTNYQSDLNFFFFSVKCPLKLYRKNTHFKKCRESRKKESDNHSVSVFCQEECLRSLPSHSVMTRNNQPIFH